MSFARRVPLPVFMLACLVLGGASAAGYIANAVLQLTAVILLSVTLIMPREVPASRSEKRLRAILVAAAGLCALQFLPLPAGLWNALGQRAHIATVNSAIGVDGWHTVSLMPFETLQSLTWLLPAVAVFAITLRSRNRNPIEVACIIVAVALISVVLGMYQMLGGSGSNLYFYEITNNGAPVGFFANSNHMATLLLISIPLTIALAKWALLRFPRQVPAVVGLAGGVLLVDFVGLFINNSLTGYILSLPVFGASLAMLDESSRIRRFATPALLGLAFILVVVLAMAGGLKLSAQQAEIDPGARQILFATTWEAAIDHLPLGSGIGSFEEIYRQYEDPTAVTSEYVNHAHNDYLEIFLETGLPGVLLVALFLGWWTVRAIRIFRSANSAILARASVIASGVVLMHSFVDYPLRTAAISAAFAFLCAVMAFWTPGDPVTPIRFRAPNNAATGNRRL